MGKRSPLPLPSMGGVVLGHSPRPASPGLAWFRRSGVSVESNDAIWERVKDGQGQHLLVCGTLGSGSKAATRYWIRQSLALGDGALVFDAQGPHPDLHAAAESLLAIGQPSRRHVFDFSASTEADPWFETPFKEAIARRDCVLVALPDSETHQAAARGVQQTLLQWVREVPTAAMRAGHTVVLMPEMGALFNGLRHRGVAHDMAERAMGCVFRGGSMGGYLADHPQASWWSVILDSVEHVAVFHQENSYETWAPLETWVAKGCFASVASLPRSLPAQSMRLFSKTQNQLLQVPEGWQPKRNADGLGDALAAAQEESRRAPFLRRGEGLEHCLPSAADSSAPPSRF